MTHAYASRLLVVTVTWRYGAATFTLDLAIGHPDVLLEMPVNLVGWSNAITAHAWIVSKVTHKLDGNGGYVTSLELENKAAASDRTAINDGDDSDADGMNGVEHIHEQSQTDIAQAA